MYDSAQEKSEVDNSLAQDLQITPDNSDNEEQNESNFEAKLSSSGSDSEHEANQSENFNEESQSYDFNASASNQQYSYPDGYAPPEAEEDGNSFDPQAFFDSFAKNQVGGEGQPTDINNDLQMSDSESDNDEGHFVEVSADMVPDDDDSNFDIEEFLQQKKE